MNFIFQTTLLLTIIAFTTPGFTAAPKSPPPAPSPYKSCITTSSGGTRLGNQSSYSFYNGCGERLYINACVTDYWGDPKIYRSGRTIQIGGRYTIYTLPGMSPDKIQWVAGPSDPGAPPLCAKK